jgi:hypothetical protein
MPSHGEWLAGFAPSKDGSSIFETRGRAFDRQLLERAVACYRLAAWEEDSCRVFVNLGDHRGAAACFRDLRRFGDAAENFELCGEWRQAAECYLLARDAERAADCWHRAGDWLEEAWVRAEYSREFSRAESVVGSTPPNSDLELVAVQIVIARCAAGLGQTGAATRRMSDVLTSLGVLSRDLLRSKWASRAREVASCLRRPDLAASIHAQDLATSQSDAEKSWQNWSQDLFGESFPLPPSVVHANSSL